MNEKLTNLNVKLIKSMPRLADITYVLELIRVNFVH